MLNQLQSSPLFSFRRALFVLVLASLVVLLDVLLLHLAGIETLAEFSIRTLILAMGLYFAQTVVAVFGTEVQL
jgi:hypothetical protein